MATDPHPDPATDPVADSTVAFDELLAAHALDALDAVEAGAVERAAAADPAVAARLDRFRRVAAGLAPAAGPRPGLALPLDAARGRRPAGRSLGRPARDASLGEVHRARVASLDELVRSLAPSDWAAPTRLGRPVQAVLAHLTGQLERTATALGVGSWEEPPADAYDHWGSTGPWLDRLGAGDAAPLVAALADVNARLAGALDRAPGDLGDLSTPAAQALVKVFELWMHADDVRLALGRPVEVPEPAALGTLCTLAADVVPVVLGLTGRARPGATVRLVLTGAGGGVWRRPAAPGEAPPPPGRSDDVTLVAEAHRFCRLFHAQLDAVGAGVHVEGDRSLAADVLAAAGALAERT